MRRRWPCPSSTPRPIPEASRAARLLVRSAWFSLVVASTASAQLRVEAEVGGARVSQAQFPALTAATVQALAGYELAWLALHGMSAFTVPDENAARVHALLGGTVRTSPARRFGAELSLGGSAYNDGVFPTSRAGYVSGRLRASGARALGWIGAGFGTLDDQINHYPTTTAEVGGAALWRGVQLAATATHHRTEGEPRTELPSERDTIAVTLRDRIAYTDLALSPRRRWGQLDVEARGGLRVVHRTIAYELRENQLFGSVDVAWWATPQLAVVAGYGRELADLARGIPATRHATLALRARLRAPSSIRAPAVRRPVVTGSAPDVLFERGSSSITTLRVLAGSAATHVEIAATFTQWEPTALVADGAGAWTFAVQLPSGPHRMLVRVNGGEWMVPANLPALDDPELGARVGILTVP